MIESKYQFYPEYKDSGLQWLGEIPAHWEIVQSRRLFGQRKERAKVGDEQLTASQKYGIIAQKKFMELEGHRVVQVLTGSEILKHIEPNDFVISMRSFQGGLEWCKQSGCVSSAYIGLIPIKHVVPEFFVYLFKCGPYIQALQSTSNLVRDGQALRFDNFTQVWLPIIPDAEQKIIASYLDNETVKIDILIEKQLQLIKLLKEKSQAVISHFATKGLNPNVPMHESGVDWLGDVPEHWELPKLIHQTSRIGDGLHSTPIYQENTRLYFVNGNNLVNGKVVVGSTAKEVSKQEYENHYIHLDKHSVLLSINGTVGNVARYDSEKIILGKSAAYINCKDGLLPEYLMLFLQSSHALHYFDLKVTGTTIFNLSLNSIRQMHICVPPEVEQMEIVRYCQVQQKKYDLLINKSDLTITFLRERRLALISSAVTGKIDLRNWQAPEPRSINTSEATA